MNTDPWGGSEVQWEATAAYCLQKKMHVTCLVYDWKEKKVKLEGLEKMGATIHYIPNKGRRKENIFQRLRFEWFTRIEQRIYINSFDFSKFDLVVVNQGGFMDVTNNPWKKLYLKLKKYCLTYHNYTLHYQFKKTKADILKNWINNAHVNIGDAIKIKSILELQLNAEFKNFTSLVNPLTIERTKTITAYPELDQGNYKIIMLAQLDIARKAQDNLIRVFALPQWLTRNVIVELYGNGEHFDLLQNLIKENNLEHKIFLKGNTNNVSAVLETSHLVLQITHRDAMPISVVEAMSKSRPVIVSNVGDMPLWVDEEINGWISEDATVNSITEVLEKAWLKRENWKQMGEHSFNTFLKRYPESVAAEFYKLISN